MEPSDRPAAHLRREAMSLARVVFAHDLPRLAASLTYYTILSLLPALIVVVAMLGLVGISPDALQKLLDDVGRLGAQWAVDVVSGALRGILSAPSSGWALAVGSLLALWVASAYVGAFMWASDGIYGVVERRPFWRELPLRLALALLLLVLLAAAAAVVALVGPFGSWAADVTGIGTGFLHVWSWIKWPILLALGLLMFGLLYRFTPARSQPALWRLLPGAGVGVALWIAASALFSIYLSHFASYDKVYGALGAGVAFLVWAWVMNLALLAGVEVNRAIEGRG